jgi:pimeloyl-ACP methyl ester carboxylesterase
VLAVDFCGHGESEPLRGGGYWPELLLGDADIALEQIGQAAVIGAGLGAYIALLLAGARPQSVPAALLLPGRGLAGGGPQPDFDRPFLTALTPADHAPLPPGCDRWVPLDLDPRPPNTRRSSPPARRLVLLEDGDPRPPWWEAARAQRDGGSRARNVGTGRGALAPNSNDHNEKSPPWPQSLRRRVG